MKIPYKDVYTYRYILEEYRGQLYPQTICTKALEKTEKYNHDPGTFARRTLPPPAVFQNGCLQPQISRSPIALKLLKEPQ